jgi:hypothetical protein
MLGVVHRANDSIPEENLLLRNHGEGQDPHSAVAPVKMEGGGGGGGGEEEEKELHTGYDNELPSLIKTKTKFNCYFYFSLWAGRLQRNLAFFSVGHERGTGSQLSPGV